MVYTGWPEKRVINKYASYKVLILDELLIDEPTAEQMHFPLELTERRYDTTSTIFCSQHATDEWHRRMGGGAHAELVMDRKSVRPSRYAKLAGMPAQLRLPGLLELRITYDLAFDRVVHNAIRIPMGDVNMRERLAKTAG